MNDWVDENEEQDIDPPIITDDSLIQTFVTCDFETSHPAAMNFVETFVRNSLKSNCVGSGEMRSKKAVPEKRWMTFKRMWGVVVDVRGVMDDEADEVMEIMELVVG